MKKALIVANLAGFASFLLNDIDTLISNGYSIYFAANGKFFDWADTKEKLVSRNVNIIQIDFDSKHPFSKANYRAYKQLKNLFKNERFDLMHCHTPIAGFIARIAAKKWRKKGMKVIYTTHGFSFHEGASRKSWLVFYNIEKIASKHCDAIITINNEDYLNAKKLKCKKVFKINGVGLNLEYINSIKIDKNKKRKELGIREDKIVVLSVGEISSRKNHKVVAEAISLLENKDDFVYLICGTVTEDNCVNEILQIKNDNNIDVRLLGFRKDIIELIQMSDFCTLPSIREGLGMAGLESLACGVPVIGSNVQGIKDYIINDVTGYLCNPFSSNEFADAIKKITINDAITSKNCIEMAYNYDKDKSRKEMQYIYSNIGII